MNVGLRSFPTSSSVYRCVVGSMGDEHTTPSPHTTRFLFPQPQQAVHTVFESKRQQGLPGVKEKPRQACLPPLRGGTRGLLVAPDGKPGSSLACYKHYDVHLDWSEVRHSVGYFVYRHCSLLALSRSPCVEIFTPWSQRVTEQLIVSPCCCHKF